MSREHVGAFCAGLGVATVACLVVKKLHHAHIAHPPIRVKGGSIVVESPNEEWTRDTDAFDGDSPGRGAEFMRGTSSERFDVTVMIGGQAKHTASGRRVIVHVDAGDNFRLVFKPHGRVRVFDKEDKLVLSNADRKKLVFSESAHIRRVVVRDGGVDRLDEKYANADDPEILIAPA